MQAYVYYLIWWCVWHGANPPLFRRVAVELHALGFSTSSPPVTIMDMSSEREISNIYV